MFDQFKRKINYLRISVTDRCNLRCSYCMPDGIKQILKHEDILTYEEILEFTRIAISVGIDKVRVTGGEPLVRKGVVNFIGELARLEGLRDISITTNGILLTQFAEALYEAGLRRINVSLDTVNPDRYREITGCGELGEVLKGLATSKEVGFSPIKINCVIQKNPGEKDAMEVAAYCLQNGFDIRYIRQMKLETGEFYPVDGGDGGNCRFCNRLRLTANGKLKPCLFSNIEYDVRKMGAIGAINAAINNKPLSGSKNSGDRFNFIGG